MNRQTRASREKTEASYHQRQTRRNQVVIVIFSTILILSLILSLIVSL